MQTKTYFATSVPAALEVARQELGADAVLMNTAIAAAEDSVKMATAMRLAIEARRGPPTTSRRAADVDE